MIRTGAGSIEPDMQGITAERVNAMLNAAELIGSRALVIEGRAIEEKFAPRPRPGKANVTVAVLGLIEEGGLKVTAFGVELRMLASGEPPDTTEHAFLIDISRAMFYTGLEEASPEELMAFGQVAALINAWPILRADVMDLAARLGVGPMVLPLMKSPPALVPPGTKPPVGKGSS